MKIRSLSLVLTGALLLGLTACANDSVERKLREDAQFWQRANVTEATYMEGPKAQQMLNRDISRCVVEIRELERLGALRNVTPGDTVSYGEPPDPDTPAGALAQWETPEREGYLRAEHLDYHDFETCMAYKGWQRLEHVPYDVAHRARENYIETIIGERHRTKTGERDEGDSYLNF